MNIDKIRARRAEIIEWIEVQDFDALMRLYDDRVAMLGAIQDQLTERNRENVELQKYKVYAELVLLGGKARIEVLERAVEWLKTHSLAYTDNRGVQFWVIHDGTKQVSELPTDLAEIIKAVKP